MFEQDVAGLIKALRANKNDEAKVIQQALNETRKEIKSKDIEVKAAAVLKLVYLEMLGNSISFASFAIVECMSNIKYHIKLIGYLAASQCFDKETEVAVLVVNLVKKDLLSPPTPMFSSSPTSTTVAHLMSTLSAVSLLLTPSLARDLAPDLLSLLTHSKALVRKQAVLVMWRVVRSWHGVTEIGAPSSSQQEDDPWIARLRERLADDDVGVVSATINLICELARKEPSKYLPLAPELFGLLTGSTNNWMLIKIIKLFAVLTPLEPRLVRKLVPPLTELIETTPAMSLLFECIQTSIVGGMLNGKEGEQLAMTCVEKLKGFLEDVDQNLRYIALVALVKILPTHPHLVATHDEVILSCVDDPDLSIRMRALDLVEGMVDSRILQPVVEHLLSHLRPTEASALSTGGVAARLELQRDQAQSVTSPPSSVILSISYRTSLYSLILRMCSSSTYANVSNFEWYIDTLVELSFLASSLPTVDSTKNSSIGSQLRDQFVNVTARVKAIRPYALVKMAELLSDEYFLENGDGAEVSEVLGAAAWICGEYCRDLQDPRMVIATLFASDSDSKFRLPPHVLSLYIHNGVKIYAYWLESLANDWEESHLGQIKSITTALEDRLKHFCSNDDMELQERATELKGLLQIVREGLDAPRPARSTMEEGDEDLQKSLREFDSLSDDPPLGEGFESNLPRLPPSCLRLLCPLFFAHELNPVNPKGQGMVSVPDGLNLDMVLVPYPAKGMQMEELGLSEEEQVDDFGRPLNDIGGDGKVLKNPAAAKAKKKLKGSTSSKPKKLKNVDHSESPESLAKLKRERLERQKEDPYYVGSAAARRPPGVYVEDDVVEKDDRGEEEDEQDIDDIPIVKLSLAELSNATAIRNGHGAAERRIKIPTRAPPRAPVQIDVEGELPEDGMVSAPSIPTLSELAPVLDEKDISVKPIESKAEEGTAVLKVVSKRGKSKSKTRAGEKQLSEGDSAIVTSGTGKKKKKVLITDQA